MVCSTVDKLKQHIRAGLKDSQIRLLYFERLGIVMRFAIVAFGLRDVVEKISTNYPQADIFNDLDFDPDEYDFIVLTSELGGEEGERLISSLDNLTCEFIIFCVTSTSFEGLERSRVQANEIIRRVKKFEGAILSGFLNFEEKVEAIRIIIDEKLQIY